MTSLDLNVFTNFTANKVEQLPILDTLASFSGAFGFDAFSNIRVFCHAAPLSIRFEDLHAALAAAIPGRSIELYSTRSLADGYARSIKASRADVLYQLEHDFRFDPSLVRHSLRDIAQAMPKAGVHCLRFNIRPNCDTELDRVSAFDMAGIPCSKTVIFSNNPHLIDRAFAVENYLPRINLTRGGSRGIEDELTKAFREGWIYGPVGYPPVIEHIDGRTQTKIWRRQRLSWRLIEFVSRNAKTVRDRYGLGRYGRIY
jgi:hypothetical protein